MQNRRTVGLYLSLFVKIRFQSVAARRRSLFNEARQQEHTAEQSRWQLDRSTIGLNAH